MNTELQSILGGGIRLSESETIPVDHLKYKGKSQRYVVWTVIDESLALAADDEPYYDNIAVDVDIYSSTDPTEIIKAIKTLMSDNEWTLSDTSPEMYEGDTKLYHRTLTFVKERYNNGL